MSECVHLIYLSVMQYSGVCWHPYVLSTRSVASSASCTSCCLLHLGLHLSSCCLQAAVHEQRIQKHMSVTWAAAGQICHLPFLMSGACRHPGLDSRLLHCATVCQWPLLLCTHSSASECMDISLLLLQGAGHHQGQPAQGAVHCYGVQLSDNDQNPQPHSGQHLSSQSVSCT